MRRQFVILACVCLVGASWPRAVRAVPMDVGQKVATTFTDVLQPHKVEGGILSQPRSETQRGQVDLLSITDAPDLDNSEETDESSISISDLNKVDEEGTWLGSRLMRLIAPRELVKTYKTWIPSPRK